MIIFNVRGYTSELETLAFTVSDFIHNCLKTSPQLRPRIINFIVKQDNYEKLTTKFEENATNFPNQELHQLDSWKAAMSLKVSQFHYHYSRSCKHPTRRLWISTAIQPLYTARESYKTFTEEAEGTFIP